MPCSASTCYRSLPSISRRYGHAAQAQALQAKLQELEAEASARNQQHAETVQQRERASAERDAAITDAGNLRADLTEAVASKERLAVALDWVADGVRYDRRMALIKAEKAKREVRRRGVPGCTYVRPYLQMKCVRSVLVGLKTTCHFRRGGFILRVVVVVPKPMVGCSY